MQRIIAENIRLPVTAPTEEIFSETARRLKKAGISDIFDIKLHKRSLDARRRGNPCFVCSVICMCDVSTKTAEHLGKYSLKLCPKKTLDFPEGNEIMRARPVVIGFGPAGMFSALILAEHGYRPIVLERGDALDDRVKKTESFFAGGALDPESNVQFGAGGQGRSRTASSSAASVTVRPRTCSRCFIRSALPRISFITQNRISEPIFCGR